MHSFAHREVGVYRLPIFRRYPEPSVEQVLGSLSRIPTLCHAGMRGKNLPTISVAGNVPVTSGFEGSKSKDS
jgi:hypothetical protein